MHLCVKNKQDLTFELVCVTIVFRIKINEVLQLEYKV